MKKVFVSGCFDLLHSGHVAFFKEASLYGDVYVGIGSDKTIEELKGRQTINSELERLYMVKAVRYVTDAWINRGSGLMDFDVDVIEFKPDLFVVNEDGHSPIKKEFCDQNGIQYVVLKRIPDAQLPPRSTTDYRNSNICRLPYRLDIAGTWIDQPYVSKYQPGWAITISLEPVIEYNERSGMSTSTRNAAKELWPISLPMERPEKLAEMLFRYENKPGTEEISGAQDSIGICVPGIVRHYYDKEYWPLHIETIHDEETLAWLEDHLWMITLWPRPADLTLLDETYITPENVNKLTTAADKCWDAIVKKDINAFADAFRQSFEAQITMFPAMMNKKIENVIIEYKDGALAWKLAGAGGGGYLVLVSEKPIQNTMKLKIRRQGIL